MSSRDRDGWARLLRVRARKRSLCVGLMSGTSADAVEAVVCDVRGTGAKVKLELLGHQSVPLPRAVSGRIHGTQSARDVAELDTLLGERFGHAALAVLASARIGVDRVDFVASHGQTLVHLPRRLSRYPASLQVGEPGVIAELTGLPVVCDFRPRDMAAGGEGAPLVPYADWALFRRPGRWRALQNIGGIANVSVVGDRLEETLAFDTGPGNMLIDAVIRRATSGRHRFDRDARRAMRGTVDEALLRALLRHPFLRRAPPRSAGKENFGAQLADELLERRTGSVEDLLATVTAFTVESIARAYERFVLPRYRLDEAFLAGGGSRNPLIVEGLRRRLAPIPVRSFSELGMDEAAKEAACFALLGHECVLGTPQNVPSATGARHPVVLGKIVF